MRSVHWIVLACATGCAATPSPATDLAAQVRALRDDQARLVRRLEMLETRISLAEDVVRAAAATMHPRRESVRITPDGDSPAAPTPSTGLESPSTSPSDDNGPRPVVRAVGRGEPGPPLPPISVHDDDRLPVTPIPPVPMPSPTGTERRRHRSRDVPDSMLPAIPVPFAAGAANAPRASSVGDPEALPTYELALQSVRNHRCAEALPTFAEFLARWPDHPYGANALYWRAQCLRERGDVQAAVREYESLLERFPFASKVPDALYGLVQGYRQLGDTGHARAYAQRLARDHAEAPVASRLATEDRDR